MSVSGHTAGYFYARAGAQPRRIVLIRRVHSLRVSGPGYPCRTPSAQRIFPWRESPARPIAAQKKQRTSDHPMGKSEVKDQIPHCELRHMGK